MQVNKQRFNKKVVLFHTVRPPMINLERLCKAASKFWWRDQNLTMCLIKLRKKFWTIYWLAIVTLLKTFTANSLQNYHPPSLFSGQRTTVMATVFCFFKLLHCYIRCSTNGWSKLMLWLCMHFILLYYCYFVSIKSKQYSNNSLTQLKVNKYCQM